jgi:hypothetical protein
MRAQEHVGGCNRMSARRRQNYGEEWPTLKKMTDEELACCSAGYTARFVSCGSRPKRRGTMAQCEVASCGLAAKFARSFKQ